jgi:hypothetical protein
VGPGHYRRSGMKDAVSHHLRRATAHIDCATSILK